MTKTESQIADFVASVEQKIRQELRSRCEAYQPDFKNPEVFSVVTALLARQATLAIEMASAPQLWNNHSAPLFLRAMTDVHITLAWILLDPPTRAKQYMEHGLGQAVLMLEHRKASLEKADEDDKPKLKAAIEAEEEWINMQKFSFLVDVKVGAWSGKTTRDMAQEANLLPFYNYVYTPFSQGAHSTWYHVGRHNSAPSSSPLTRLLWIAHVPSPSSDPWNLHLAAKYVDKSFNEFDAKALEREPCSNIHDWIYDEIQKRFRSHSDSAEE